jgi:hypothetical protein
MPLKPHTARVQKYLIARVFRIKGLKSDRYGLSVVPTKNMPILMYLCRMGRFFNTAGPCVAANHYIIDPLSRLSRVRQLIDDERYFVLHAPRQTGKTTTMLGLMRAINSVPLKHNCRPAILCVPIALSWSIATRFLSSTGFLSCLMNQRAFLLPKQCGQMF